MTSMLAENLSTSVGRERPGAWRVYITWRGLLKPVTLPGTFRTRDAARRVARAYSLSNPDLPTGSNRPVPSGTPQAQTGTGHHD